MKLLVTSNVISSPPEHSKPSDNAHKQRRVNVMMTQTHTSDQQGGCVKCLLHKIHRKHTKSDDRTEECVLVCLIRQVQMSKSSQLSSQWPIIAMCNRKAISDQVVLD